MKKLILISLAVIGISSVAYASSNLEDCSGANRFVENLNLDEARGYEVEQILGSYSQIKDLAMNGDFDQIPVFIEQRQAELQAVLTADEMQQFKENVGEWAEKKDFSKYKMFSEKSFSQDH